MKIVETMFKFLIIVISIYFSSSSSNEHFQKNIGDNVTFSCLLENSSQIDQVSFLFQTTGDLLSVGKDLFSSLDDLTNEQMKLELINPTRLDLKIFFLIPSHSGLYTCMIHQQILASFSLEIFVRPSFISYNPHESRLSLPEGSSMNFSCYVDANPPVTIQWNFQNSTSIYSSKKHLHQGEEFPLDSIEIDQSGTYECVASNGFHSTISRKFNLFVHYRPRVLIDERIRHENNSFLIDCQICSNPMGKVLWTKDEKILHEDSSTISIEQTKHSNDDQCFHSILFLRSSQFHLFGRYQCQSSNYLGYHSNHIDLHPRSVKSPSHSHRISSKSSNRTKFLSDSSGNSARQMKFSLIISMIFFVKFVN